MVSCSVKFDWSAVLNVHHSALEIKKKKKQAAEKNNILNLKTVDLRYLSIRRNIDVCCWT